MDLHPALEVLKSSMIFDMSLGSKELFHSNVWGFLIENDHRFINVFVPFFVLNEYQKIEVSREWHHRDLIIWLTDNHGNESHIVIENKIKSIPTYEQLEEYTENVGKYSFKEGVLTGIGETNYLDFSTKEKLKGRWSYVNYKTISEKIRTTAKTSKETNIINNLGIIEEYCDVLDSINVCLECYLSDLDSSEKLDYNCGELGSLRIDDVYKKLKGADFLRYVKGKESFENICPKGFKPIISQDFHNGKTTLDFRFVNDSSEVCNVIGVQLEGNQFRICVQCSKNNVSNLKGKYSDILYNRFKDDWFDDSFVKNAGTKYIFKHETFLKPRGDKKYDSYETNDYCFVYQYFNIDQSNNCYDKLFKLIIEFMNKASEVIRSKLSN